VACNPHVRRSHLPGTRLPHAVRTGDASRDERGDLDARTVHDQTGRGTPAAAAAGRPAGDRRHRPGGQQGHGGRRRRTAAHGRGGSRRHHAADRPLLPGLGRVLRLGHRSEHPHLRPRHRAAGGQPEVRAGGRGHEWHRRRHAARRHQPGRRPRLHPAERAGLGEPHPRRPERVQQLHDVQHGLHDHQHPDSAERHRRTGSGALRLRGAAARAGPAASQCPPRAGHRGLGVDAAGRPHAEPQPGGAPRRLRRERALRRRDGRAGPRRLRRHHRPRRAAAAGGQDRRRPQRPRRDLGDVRRSRDGEQGDLAVLQRRPPRHRRPGRGGHPAAGGRSGCDAGHRKRLRQRRRGRPDGRHRAQRAGRRRLRRGRGGAGIPHRLAHGGQGHVLLARPRQPVDADQDGRPADQRRRAHRRRPGSPACRCSPAARRAAGRSTRRPASSSRASTCRRTTSPRPVRATRSRSASPCRTPSR